MRSLNEKINIITILVFCLAIIISAIILYKGYASFSLMEDFYKRSILSTTLFQIIINWLLYLLPLFLLIKTVQYCSQGISEKLDRIAEAINKK